MFAKWGIIPRVIPSNTLLSVRNSGREQFIRRAELMEKENKENLSLKKKRKRKKMIHQEKGEIHQYQKIKILIKTMKKNQKKIIQQKIMKIKYF